MTPLPAGRLLALGLLLLLSRAAPGAEPVGVGSTSLSLMSAEGLEARIAQTELDAELDAETKSKVLARYREGLSNLKEADVNRDRAARFEEIIQAAPEEARRIRERTLAADPDSGAQPPALDVRPDATREEIERHLMRTQADLAAALARHADFERRRSFHEERPNMIRRRLAEAQEQQDAIAAALKVDPGAGVQSALTATPTPALEQAGWWSLETRYVALSTEIRALEQELLSLPMRLDLLEAQRDEEAGSSERLRPQVDRLKAVLNDRFATDAARAKDEAGQMLTSTRGMDPVLIGLARQNVELTARLTETVATFDDHDEEISEAIRLTERIKGELERVQAAREVSGLTDGIGPLLLEHHAALPDFKAYQRTLNALDQQIAAVNVSRLRHLDEASRLADLERAVTDLSAGLSADHGPDMHNSLRTLVIARQGLLAKQIEAEEAHLSTLRTLKASDTRMLEVARGYKHFLEEHLFWLDSTVRVPAQDVATLLTDSRRLLAPAVWSELRNGISGQIKASPVYWLTFLVAGVLFWKRRALLAVIARTSMRIEHRSKADARQTLFALVLTLMIAAPLPLLFAMTGWELQSAPAGTEVSGHVGAHLIRIAVVLYGLLALRAICLPSGLALGHFGWSEPTVRKLRSELGWLIWVVIPAMLLVEKAAGLNPYDLGGLVARIASMVAMLAVALFLFRLFHPKRGVFPVGRQRVESRLLHRAYWIWYPLLAGFPLLILVLGIKGYSYSALVLWDAYLLTLGLIATLVVLHALASSWLTLARQRLARQVARERRQVAVLEREAVSGDSLFAPPSELADVDVEAASAAGRELLGIAVVLLALIGLYAIWSPVFPAMGIFQEVTLWLSTSTLGGETVQRPITLASVALAVFYLVAVVVLAKRLPAMLDIILAERLHVASSSRYTVTTLTTYVIFAIGLVLALNSIGAQWSQLQWLVAALSVGIGFGLQEIVANFVSGIIILFERPVRVGDVVTVGGTDGVVTKIRIRATTIRGYDRKELLVPNKELITGRLLNWSLSDAVTRLMIVVGVAYDTDVEKAHALMREAAEENPRVLSTPKPAMNFEGFGDSALTLTLRAYIEDIENRVAITSEINTAINRKFRDAGIVIAYPQRDLHLSAVEPLRVTLDKVDSPRQQ